MSESLNRFVPGLPSTFAPVTLAPTVAQIPATGVGTAAGGFATATERDNAIVTINNLVARIGLLEEKFRELGIVT